MVSTFLKVAAADIAIIAAELLVVGDLQQRGTYATMPHGSTSTGYLPSLAYGFLTHVFTMTGGSLPLVSPTTLDWTQVFALAFVVINGWYLYPIYSKRKARRNLTSSS